MLALGTCFGLVTCEARNKMYKGWPKNQAFLFCLPVRDRLSMKWYMGREKHFIEVNNFIFHFSVHFIASWK